jgi:chemotaxis methyl-accepting protein methylase
MASRHLMTAEARPAAAVDDLDWLLRALEIVRERTGVDFRGYRVPTLLRRMRNRMLIANVESPSAYLALLQSDPGEARRLIARLTIKVSEFFRDGTAFDALERALRRRSAACPARRLRVWSAGCGQGEEAFSLAILLDTLGQTADGVDVVATDIDVSALRFAANARYPASALRGVAPTVRARYFDEEPSTRGSVYRVRGELRERVELRLHDLAGAIESPDGERFDVVCCRNVLIYFQPAFQERVERLLARSLLPGGLLWLGEAEWLLPVLAPRFDVLDRRARLFQLLPRPESEVSACPGA